LDALGRLVEDYNDGKGKRTRNTYEKGGIFG
jgi:hypothetical protein